MVLMYCYGSSFHANRYRLATPSATSQSLHASASCGNGNAATGHAAGASADGGDGGDHGNRGDGDTIETLAGTTLTANGSGLEHHSCDGNTLTGITAITPMSVSFSDKKRGKQRQLVSRSFQQQTRRLPAGPLPVLRKRASYRKRKPEPTKFRTGIRAYRSPLVARSSRTPVQLGRFDAVVLSCVDYPCEC
uniref:Uncharacterized protein n=1 Tax=Anopheles atroparvus TaxID=41427 RepID=A0A182J1A0_ANOAO